MKNWLKSLTVSLMLFAGCIACGFNSNLCHAQVTSPTAGTVANLTLTSANTEYSYALPQGTAAVTVKSRTVADFKMSFTSGASGSTYFTVPAGSAYYETEVSSFGNTLYIQSANAGQVVEIVTWK